MAVCGRALLIFSECGAVLRSEHVDTADILDTVETESSSSRPESASSDSYRLGVSYVHQCLGEGAELPVGVLAMLGITVDRPESIDAALLKSDSSPAAVRADCRGDAADAFSLSSSGQDMKAGSGGSAAADGLDGLAHRTGWSRAPALSTDVRFRSPAGARCRITSPKVIADTGRIVAGPRLPPVCESSPPAHEPMAFPPGSLASCPSCLLSRAGNLNGSKSLSRADSGDACAKKRDLQSRDTNKRYYYTPTASSSPCPRLRHATMAEHLFGTPVRSQKNLSAIVPDAGKWEICASAIG